MQMHHFLSADTTGVDDRPVTVGRPLLARQGPRQRKQPPEVERFVLRPATDESEVPLPEVADDALGVVRRAWAEAFGVAPAAIGLDASFASRTSARVCVPRAIVSPRSRWINGAAGSFRGHTLFLAIADWGSRRKRSRAQPGR